MSLPRSVLVACVAAALPVLLAPAARAFSLFPQQSGTPSAALGQAARWADGWGLEDGIQVGVAPGTVTAIGATTAQEQQAFRDGIVAAFDAWENPALRFDVQFDAAATTDPTTGFEIDLLALPASDPVFAPSPTTSGLANLSVISAQRTLTNGTSSFGDVIVGADIYLNSTVIAALGQQLPGVTLPEAVAAFTWLVIHEAGHTLGLGHPDPAANYDTNTDPLDAMALDPADPFASLIFSAAIDTEAIMVSRPCPPPQILCEANMRTQLRPDDAGGRDALYPVLVAAPEPALAPPLALAAVAAGLWRRARAG